jgi:hypothetical protein
MHTVKLINVLKIFTIGLAGMIAEAVAETGKNYVMENIIATQQGILRLCVYLGVFMLISIGFLVYKFIKR